MQVEPNRIDDDGTVFIRDDLRTMRPIEPGQHVAVVTSDGGTPLIVLGVGSRHECRLMVKESRQRLPLARHAILVNRGTAMLEQVAATDEPIGCGACNDCAGCGVSQAPQAIGGAA
jgi:hypothetical protein